MTQFFEPIDKNCVIVVLTLKPTIQHVNYLHFFSAVVELGLYLETKWTDARINVLLPDCYGVLYSTDVERMWLPRPYMLSTAYIESVKTNPATDYYFFEPPNIFRRYQELNVGVQCPFEFSYYPFDSHTCKVQFHDSSSTDRVVHYNSSVDDASDDLQHALKYDIVYRNFTDKEDFHIGYESGEGFSACGFYIDLHRKRGPAIINVFIPSCLIVLIAFCRYGLILVSLGI